MHAAVSKTKSVEGCSDLFPVLLFRSATASQQETETEPNSDPAVKPSGHSPGTQPPATGSIADKSNSPSCAEKSKDSTGVTVT